MASGIYRIDCAVNGKAYIGSALMLSRRKAQHFNKLRSGVHSSGKDLNMEQQTEMMPKVTLRHPHTKDTVEVEATPEDLTPWMVKGYGQVKPAAPAGEEE